MYKNGVALNFDMGRQTKGDYKIHKSGKSKNDDETTHLFTFIQPDIKESERLFKVSVTK